MIIKYAQGNKINYNMRKYLVEEENELSQIPRCNMGSTAYVITTSLPYVRLLCGTSFRPSLFSGISLIYRSRFTCE